MFKAALPEWEEYVRRDRLTAGTLAHRESGMLVELTMEAALRAGKHCWVDSMVDHDQEAASSKVGIDGGREFGARRCVAVEPGGEVDERDEIGV